MKRRGPDLKGQGSFFEHCFTLMQLSALYALTQPLILASECVSQLKGKRDDDKKQKALPTDAGGAFFG
jgi:hypothetical protein